MNMIEYRQKCDEIRIRARTDTTNLMRRYAEDHSLVKLGDIVTDHIGSIRVDGWSLYRDELCPSLVYSGMRYTKTGKPFKSREKTEVYQINLV